MKRIGLNHKAARLFAAAFLSVAVSANAEEKVPSESTSAAESSISMDQELWNDPAFNTLVHLGTLRAAITRGDSKLLTDSTLQFVEGEKALLRSHKAITAESLLVRAINLSAENKDKVSLVRLEKVVEQLGNPKLSSLLANAQKLAAASRSLSPVLQVPVMSMSVETYARYKALIDDIRTSALIGDAKVLKEGREYVDKVPGLTPDRKQQLREMIDGFLQSVPDDEGQVTAFAKLVGTSRGDYGDWGGGGWGGGNMGHGNSGGGWGGNIQLGGGSIRIGQGGIQFGGNRGYGNYDEECEDCEYDMPNWRNGIKTYVQPRTYVQPKTYVQPTYTEPTYVEPKVYVPPTSTTTQDPFGSFDPGPTRPAPAPTPPKTLQASSEDPFGALTSTPKVEAPRIKTPPVRQTPPKPSGDEVADQYNDEIAECYGDREKLEGLHERCLRDRHLPFDKKNDIIKLIITLISRIPEKEMEYPPYVPPREPIRIPPKRDVPPEIGVYVPDPSDPFVSISTPPKMPDEPLDYDLPHPFGKFDPEHHCHDPSKPEGVKYLSEDDAEKCVAMKHAKIVEDGVDTLVDNQSGSDLLLFHLVDGDTAVPIGWLKDKSNSILHVPAGAKIVGVENLDAPTGSVFTADGGSVQIDPAQ